MILQMKQKTKFLKIGSSTFKKKKIVGPLLNHSGTNQEHDQKDRGAHRVNLTLYLYIYHSCTISSKKKKVISGNEIIANTYSEG